MAPKTSYYTGSVCYQDGWHWSVIEDEADRERCVAIAQAHLDFAKKKGDADKIAAAETELERVNSADYHVPDQRLVCEDTEDGSESRYRLATDDDERSWHDRKHTTFSKVELEDGSKGLTVNDEEFAAIEQMLAERRAEGGER